MISVKLVILLFAALASIAFAETQVQESGARKLSAYSGSSSNAHETVTTTDNGDGTSTTCSTNKYETHCSTYANGEPTPKPSTTGRKMLEGSVRKLSAYSGTSSNPYETVTTTDNGNGTSTTCSTNKYETHCSTYANGEPTPTPKPSTGRK